MKSFIPLAALTVVVFATLASADDQAASTVDFARDIQPILKKNCVACHRAKMTEGGLSLESYDEIVKGGDSGAGVVAKNNDDSLILARASGAEEPIMPPEDNSVGAKQLTEKELELLRRWIQAGAPNSQSQPTESISWQPIPESVKAIYTTDVSPDGRSVLVATANRVNLVDAGTGTPIAKLTDPALQPPGVADVDMIQSVAVSPLGNVMATGGFRTVRFWRPANSEAPENIVFTAGNVYSRLSPDGKRVALTNAISDIEIWGVDSQQVLHTIKPTESSITGIVWITDQSIAASDQTGTLTVFNLADGKVIKTTKHAAALESLAINHDRTRLASIDASGRLVQFNNAEKITTTLNEAIADVTAVQFVRIPKPAIAVATKANVIHVVALDNGQSIYQLKHEGPLSAIAASADGATLASGDGNGKLILWNLADGKPRATLQGTRSSALRLAIAQRDAAREKATVDRLQKATETLNAELKKEDELLKKVTEAHKKATDELTAEAKKESDAQAKLKTVEQKLASAKQTFDTSEQNKKDTEAQIAQLMTAMQADTAKLQTMTKQSQEAATALAAVKQQVADLQKKLTEAQTNADKIAKQAADAKTVLETKQKDVETKKQQIATYVKAAADAKSMIDAATKEVETVKKEVTTVTESKTKKESEIAKRKQALDTATVSRKRAADAIPAHQSLIAKKTHHRDAAHRKAARIGETHSAADRITSIAFSPDGKSAAAFTTAGWIKTLDPATGAWTGEHQATKDFDEAAEAIAAFIDNNTLFLRGGRLENQLIKPSRDWVLSQKIGEIADSKIVDRVTCMDFHKDGELIAIGSGEPSRSGQVLIYSTKTGKLLREFSDIHSDSVLALRFSPDGRTLATAAADKTVRLIDVHLGTVIRSLDGHSHHVLGISWSSDGLTVATGSADKTVKVWDTESGKQKRTISGFGDEVTAIVFLPNSPQVITACADGQVRLHDTNNGKQIKNAAVAGDFLFTVSLSPDGKSAASGGQNGVATLWTVQTLQEQRKLTQ